MSVPSLLRDGPSPTVERLVERVLSVDAVETIDFDWSDGNLVIAYDCRRLPLADALHALAVALRDDGPEGPAPAAARLSARTARIDRRQWLSVVRASELSRTGRGRPIVVARGVRRVVLMTAAGGCFVMSFVGLVTPGIPTVPFVLATSYFLVRSSPTLNERFRNSRWFGPMARDWETYGGLRPRTKRNALLVTFGLMGITLIVTRFSVPFVLLAVVMGTLGTVLIVRLPGVPQDAPDLPARLNPPGETRQEG